ncbi:HAD family hydrolase [bacterium]|nr:HAD family hydrolase [bacterium]
MQKPSKQKAVFLDRDGTINVDLGYINRPEDLVLIKGAAAAIGNLKRSGFHVFVVTNQSVIGRGEATSETIEQIHARMQQLLSAEDPAATLDYIAYCPHLSEDNCQCRKPKTAMFAEISQRFSIDLGQSYMVGDKLSDLEFGWNIGLPKTRAILVHTGYGVRHLAKVCQENDVPVHVNSILEAQALITSN